MKLVVAGATGFTGSEVLKQALADDGISAVLVLTRRPTGLSHPKLQERLINDFTDYSDVDLRGWDACVWALGVSQTQVNEADYIRITHDYALAAARALWAASPEARFVFVSGQSADQTADERGTGGSLYQRIKGRTERALAQLDGAHAFFARPGYIRATARSVPRRDAGRLFRPLASLLNAFGDQLVIDCDVLARALLRVARDGASAPILDNVALRARAG